MKKNIAIIILSITTLLGAIYSFAQKTIAERAEQEALRQREFAEEQTIIAQMTADSARVEAKRAQIAEIMAAKAMEEKLEAEDKLKKCK